MIVFKMLLTLLALFLFSTGAHAHGHHLYPAASRVDVHSAVHRHRVLLHRSHSRRAVIHVKRAVVHLHHRSRVVRAARPVVADRFVGGQAGIASWYGPTGNKTASGEVYNQMAATCAHRSLPFGTLVRVVAQATGKSITCRVNDRGPFVRGRIIDLSKAGARDLGILGAGTASVTLVIDG